MAWKLAAGLAALALSACSGASRPLPLARPPTARPATEPPPPGELVISIPEDPDPRVRPLPRLAGASGTRYLVGGVMAELQGARVTFSPDLLAGTPRCIAEVDGGWVFVTEDGLITASETFTGAMRRLGQLEPSIECEGDTRGRLLVRGRNGTRLADARGLTEVTGAPAPLLSAAFSDPRRGLGILEDGRLALTRDGGGTWSALDLGAALALTVRFRDGALRVETTRGSLSLGDDGALRAEPSPPRRDDQDRDEPDPTNVERVERAWRARAEGAPDHARALPDGSTLALDGHLLVHRARDGATLSRSPLRPSNGGLCELSSWGRGVALRCDGLFRTTDGETWEPVFSPRSSGRTLILSDDGLHAVMEGPCDADERSLLPDPGRVCALNDAGEWRELSLPELTDRSSSYTELVGMHGGLLLLRAHTERAWEQRVLDVGTGAVTELTFVPPDPREWRLGRLSWTRDGLLAGLAYTGEGEHLETARVLGPPRQALPTRHAPHGAVAAHFLDDSRGLAAGRRLGQLWRTDDGGETWEPLPLPLEPGSDRALDRARELTCDRDDCLLDRLFRLRGWGRPRVTGTRLILPAPRAERQPSQGPSRSLGELRCEAVGAPTESPWHGHPEAAVRAMQHGPLSALHGGTARELADALGFDLRAGLDTHVLWVSHGGLAATVLAEHYAHGRGLSVVFEVDPTGTPRTQRAFFRPILGQGALALDRGRWGWVALTSSEPLRFLPLSGPPGRSEPLPSWEGPLPLCADRAPTEAVMLYLACTPDLIPASRSSINRCRAEVALAPTGACLRAAQLTGPLSFSRLPGARVVDEGNLSLRARGGRLEGFLDDLTARTTIRCEANR